MPENKISSPKTVPPRAYSIDIVKLLMYAFGDDPNPSPDSVAVLEDIVTEYINEMVPPKEIALRLLPVAPPHDLDLPYGRDVLGLLRSELIAVY